MKEKKYFEFLAWCLREEEGFPSCASDIVWHDLLRFALQQSIVGVYFHGIRRLGGMEENKPTDDDVMEWMSYVRKIEHRNRQLYTYCTHLSEKFKQEGFRSCVLKGQGNALMYPDVMMRTPGDIDLWLEGGKQKVVDYVHRLFPDEDSSSPIHIHFDIINGLKLELHYAPGYMHHPKGNRLMTRFFQEQASLQFENWVDNPEGGQFSVPTKQFNLLIQMSHIDRHVVGAGIGLRQMIDFYYLLKSGEYMTFPYRQYGLHRISGAVMYVLHEYLGLEERYLVDEPNRKYGKMLMTEIIAGGNFGQYDSRWGASSKNSVFKRRVVHLIRKLYIFRLSPLECLWYYNKVVRSKYLWFIPGLSS